MLSHRNDDRHNELRERTATGVRMSELHLGRSGLVIWKGETNPTRSAWHEDKLTFVPLILLHGQSASRLGIAVGVSTSNASLPGWPLI